MECREIVRRAIEMQRPPRLPFWQHEIPSAPDDVRREARQLVRHWSTPERGLVVFNYGDPRALAVKPEMTEVMFDEFVRLKGFWQQAEKTIGPP